MFRSSRAAAARARNAQQNLLSDILSYAGGGAGAGGSTTDEEVKVTPLLAAYNDKDYEKLQQLLSESVDEAYGAASGADGRSVGEIAASDGAVKALRVLAAAGVDFNKKCADSKVPLHHALAARRLRTVRLLCELGAATDVTFPSGASPLHWCCSQPNVQLLECLLKDCSANPEVYDKARNTPLHRACLEDSYQHVAALIEFCNESVINHRGYEGKTALHIAVGNQNRRIIRLLLQQGAFVDVAANNGRTAIDMIMKLNSVVMMSDLAQFYTGEMSKAVTATSFKELATASHFQQFLGFLDAVDCEFFTGVPEGKPLTASEEKDLLRTLVRDSKLDPLEFRQIVMKLLNSDSYVALVGDGSSELLKKVAGNVVRYILYREDAQFLKKLVIRGLVWAPMQSMIESRIDAVYLHTPDRGFAGVYSHFVAKFVKDGTVDWSHLLQHYSRRCSIFNMAPPSEEDRDSTAGALRHPMCSLVIWAILCGRFKVVETLLQLEKVELIPLSLFAAAIVRTFGGNCSVNVDEDFVERKALTCERFAAKVIDSVYEVDTSHHKHVTVEYLLSALPSYGGVSCIDIAGKNGSASFLQTEPGQLALERKWYGMLYDTGVLKRELLILLGIMPFNPVLPWLLYKESERQRLEAKLQKRPMKASADTNEEVQDATFLFRESTAADADANAIVEEEEEEEEEKETEDGKKKDGGEEGGDQDGKEKKKDEVPKQQQQQQKKQKLGTVARILKLIYEFYMVPAVRFRYHAMSHVVMVLLMSYELLISWNYNTDIAEVVMYLIVTGFLLEELGEFIHIVLEENVSSFFASKWNLIDIAAVLCAMVSLGIRVFSRSSISEEGDIDDNFMNFEDPVWYVGRIFLSISCLLYWVRLLYISTVMETLGPKLKMITKMTTKDMIPFLFILFIFIFGFGVLIQSLLFPNGLGMKNPEKMTLTDAVLQLFKICFYGMVGDYSLDMIMGSDCDDVYAGVNKTSKVCPHSFGRYLVPYFVMPLYVIVTEILLLNLIIALFSKTIDQIDSKSTALWQFERNDLIDEFLTRSSFPPPFNVLPLMQRLLLRCAKFLCPAVAARFQKKPAFSQKLLLQFLLFQAFSLRNKRQELMEDSISEVAGNSEQEQQQQQHQVMVGEQLQQLQDQMQKMQQLQQQQQQQADSRS